MNEVHVRMNEMTARMATTVARMAEMIRQTLEMIVGTIANARRMSKQQRGHGRWVNRAGFGGVL